jgi:hypothetical protein
MALNAKTDPNYVPKRINGKFAPGCAAAPCFLKSAGQETLAVPWRLRVGRRKPWRFLGGYA